MDIENVITKEEALREINLGLASVAADGMHSLLFGHMTKTLSLNLLRDYALQDGVPHASLNDVMEYVKAENPNYVTMVTWFLEAIAEQVGDGLEVFVMDEGFLLSWSNLVCLVLVEHQSVIELGQETGAITLQ